MFRKILFYGVIAGLIAGVPMAVTTISRNNELGGLYAWGLGYLIMLIALTAVFIAVKRHRDVDRGGIIKFWPALGMGLGISIVAGILYAAAWDIALAVSHWDFAGEYTKSMIAQRQAKGVSGAALAKFTAEMARFRTNYANPFYRWPMTFAEIFPVGVLVSLISAGLLRNPRFLPIRRA